MKMKRAAITLGLLTVLCCPKARAAGWTVGAASCGTSPSGSVTQQVQIGSMWFVAITGTIGSGTVTSCVLNFQTDGKVGPYLTGAPSCLADDTTAGTALGVAFSATNTGTWGYGQVTLTSPGAVNIAGHTVTMWCVR